MNFEESGNPVLGKETFKKPLSITGEVMTFQGALNKTFLLLLLTFGAAYFTWSRTTDVLTVDAMYPYMIGGAIGGFVVAMVTVFKKEWAMYTAPLYAILEGLFLGGLSAFFEMRYPGIATQAIIGTFGVFASLLVLYRTGIIRATNTFKKIVFGATAGIAVYYLISIGMSFFGMTAPLIHDNSMLGIGFTLVVVIVAALNLVLDFDFIDKASANGAPKYMEWYAGFSLMVTLVWLYVEILRLLSKLRD